MICVWFVFLSYGVHGCLGCVCFLFYDVSNDLFPICARFVYECLNDCVLSL